MTLTDVTSLPLSVNVGGGMSVMVPRGTPFPVHMARMHTTHMDAQPEVRRARLELRCSLLACVK